MIFNRHFATFISALLLTAQSFAQNNAGQAVSQNGTAATSQKIVVVTGNRFSYKLVQRWIDDYNKIAPGVQIIIESRGSTDPNKYDILAEVYPQEAETQKNREYLNVGR